ncbi:MAG: hypothetical protein ACXWXT_00620 [Candidatus Binatia bacterium]
MNGKYAARKGSSAITSRQYLGVFGRSENLEPEKALLLAVLEDAIHCFRHYSSAGDRVGQRRFRDAESWIQQQERDWAFTFDNVCELLGFEPEYMRRKIIEEERSGKWAGPQSGYLNGSGEPRYSPKRARNGGLVDLLDRRR